MDLKSWAKQRRTSNVNEYEQVMNLAKERYEEENGCSWEEADKYEREDYVWAAYMEVKGEKL